jgi:hypothetical protein
MRLAKFIYSTIITAMLVATYFIALVIFGIEFTDEIKALGIALWLLAYHYAGVEFQLIDLHDTLLKQIKPGEDKTPTPEPPDFIAPA